MFNIFNIYYIMAMSTFIFLFCFKDSDYKLPLSREIIYVIVMALLWPMWLYMKFGDKNGL